MEIYWREDQKYYVAEVTKFRAARATHDLHYTDGEVEWDIYLPREMWRRWGLEGVVSDISSEVEASEEHARRLERAGKDEHSRLFLISQVSELGISCFPATSPC